MTRVSRLLVVLCLITPSLASSQGANSELTARALKSSQVVVGKVVDVTGRNAANAAGDRLIYSDLVIEISETLKGEPESLVRVTIEGGELGGVTLKIPDVPTMRPGDRAIFFLTRGSDGQWLPSGPGRGIVRVGADGRLENSPLTLGQARACILSAC